MTKIFEFIENNAIKIIITIIIAWGLFFGILYIQGIKKDILSLKELVTTNQSIQEESSSLTINGLLFIIQQLEELAKYQQYSIDQNREKIDSDKKIIQKTSKPTYKELRSHSVWIEGCSGGKNKDNEVGFPIDNSDSCWGGTGVIVKITETETYILTNSHVAGGSENNVLLYVKNDETQKLIKAEIIKHHNSVDAAVIKIQGILPNKTAIKNIASVNIQDPVYVVGNPLGVRDIYTEGIVAGYSGIDLLVQMPCIFGNSGSGVFDRNGDLVGIVYALEIYPGWMGIPQARITHSLVVDNISIKLFLKDLGLYE